MYDSSAAHVLAIENAWLSYRNQRIFKLLKHAIRAAVSDTEGLMTTQKYSVTLCVLEVFMQLCNWHCKFMFYGSK